MCMPDPYSRRKLVHWRREEIKHRVVTGSNILHRESRIFCRHYARHYARIRCTVSGNAVEEEIVCGYRGIVVVNSFELQISQPDKNLSTKTALSNSGDGFVSGRSLWFFFHLSFFQLGHFSISFRLFISLLHLVRYRIKVRNAHLEFLRYPLHVPTDILDDL
jgi:hypothetical protein